MRRLLLWGGLLTVGTAYEWWAISTHHDDQTLTAFTRAAFHTDTAAGRVIFTLAWGAFAAWFVHHILSGRNRK